MGQVREVIPQGPSQHCSDQQPHDMHLNTEPGTLKGSHCDGVPVLEPFVELTVRVPLKAFGANGGHVSHQGILRLIGERGLGAIVDAMNSEHARVALRVRAGDRDRVYPIFERSLPRQVGSDG